VKHLRSSRYAAPPRRLRSTKTYELSFLRYVVNRVTSLLLRLSPQCGSILVISTHTVQDNIVLNVKHRSRLTELRDLMDRAMGIIANEKTVVVRRLSRDGKFMEVHRSNNSNSAWSGECDGFSSSLSSTCSMSSCKEMLEENDLFCDEEMEMDLDEF